MDGPFLICNGRKLQTNVECNQQPEDVHFEYQILNNVPVCNNDNTTSLTTIINDSENEHSAENANLFANSWMTPDSISKLKDLLNEWNFGSLFSVFYGNCE